MSEYDPSEVQPAAEPGEDESVEGSGDETAVPSSDVIDYSIPSHFIASVDKEVSLDSLKFDVLCEMGQIRPLLDQQVEEVRQSYRTNPLNEPVRLVLWPPQVGVQQYVVLGGQHQAKALMLLRQEYLERSEPVPPQVTTVLGKVLLHETPLEVRQRVAGDHQASQTAVHAVPLWRLFAMLVDTLRRAPTARPLTALAGSIQKAGVRRPSTWSELKERWGPILVVAQTLMEQAAPAIKRLEESTPGGISLNVFRNVRSLYTLEHRKEACRYLLEEKATVKGFAKKLEDTLKEQWVSFNWRADNPLIEAEKGISRATVVQFPTVS